VDPPLLIRLARRFFDSSTTASINAVNYFANQQRDPGMRCIGIPKGRQSFSAIDRTLDITAIKPSKIVTIRK
jgi:hypothetical protein